MSKELYLLLGSNLGDKKMNLTLATNAIAAELGNVVKSSSLYETEPWGEIPTETFINQMLMIETRLSPLLIMDKIIKIEEGMGRKREKKWENRLIDIDIIFYNNEVLETEKLTIPHPQFHNRNFAILPMLELSPQYIHPVLNISIEDIYLNSMDEGEVLLIEDEE